MLPAYRKDRAFTTCPTCGSPARMIYRDDGRADHYEVDFVSLQSKRVLAEVDAKTDKRLRSLRAGKKTVALVGKSPTSCSLAPYKDNNVEIWTLTNAHKYDWMRRWNRLFEMHPKAFIAQYDPAQPAFLMEKHDKPIYMQYKHDNVPDSVEYPFRDIVDALMTNAYHGDVRIKYFTSTFSYMIALAIYEGFQRIECYGFEMQFDDAWGYQRKNAEFWMGGAILRGLDFYLPSNCPILKAKLYGYEEVKPDMYLQETQRS